MALHPQLPQYNVITHEHVLVHEGEFFQTCVLNTSVANTSAIQLLIQCAASKSVHLYVKLVAGGDALFQMYEGPTFSAAGDALTAHNHNRVSSKTASGVFTSSPTVSDNGTLMCQEFLAGGTGQGNGATPGAVQGLATEQYVLSPGEDYLLKLTNNAGSNQPLQIIVAFYEVSTTLVSDS